MPVQTLSKKYPISSESTQFEVHDKVNEGPSVESLGISDLKNSEEYKIYP